MRLSRFQLAILGGVGILCAVSVGISLRNIAVSVPVMADLTNLPAIIIDPGHGGGDGGAVGIDGTVEKDINLRIGLILRDMLQVNGFDVIVTRDTDISIHDEGVNGIKKQKTSDLHNRLAIIQEHPGCIFISIHQNKFGSAQSYGTQIFYGPKNPQSERLAGIAQAAFVRNLQPGNTRQHKKAGKNLYLMYEAECPAILVECGFLSNANDLQLLKDTEYQSKVAFTAFHAVMEYLELDTRDNGTN